jgi:hypothetical protein
VVRKMGLLLAVLMLAGCGTGRNVYESKEAGVRLEYPDGWTENEKMPMVTIAFEVPKADANPALPESVMLEAHKVWPEIDTTEKYTQAYEAKIDADPTATVKLVDSSAVELGGLPGRRVTCTGKKNDLDVKYTQVWTVKDGMAYFFTYGATVDKFDKFLKQAEAIIFSAEFFKATPKPVRTTSMPAGE